MDEPHVVGSRDSLLVILICPRGRIMFGVSKHHLAQVGKVKKSDKWVSHELNDAHKERRLEKKNTKLHEKLL